MPTTSPAWMRRSVKTYLLENGYDLPARILGTFSLLLTLAIISDTNAIAPVATSVDEFYARRSALGSNIRVLAVTDVIEVSPYSIVLPAQRELSPAAGTVLAILEQKIRQAENATHEGVAPPEDMGWGRTLLTASITLAVRARPTQSGSEMEHHRGSSPFHFFPADEGREEKGSELTGVPVTGRPLVCGP